MATVDDGNAAISTARRITPAAVVSLLVCVGVALSTAAFLAALGWEREYIRAQFERDATDRIAALAREIDQHALVLDCLGGLFDASEKVERAEFRAFTDPILWQHAGVQALAWVPRVSEAERKTLEHAAQQDGLADFTITERDNQGRLVGAARRSEYFPIYYVQPYADNAQQAGFDLGSDPARLIALRRSCDTGKTVTAVQAELAPESNRRSELLMFRPVYQHDAPLDTVVNRRESLMGFVVSEAYVDVLVEHALSFLDPRGVDVRLEDPHAADGQHSLYTHASRMRSTAHASATEEKQLEAGQLRHTATLVLPGREWSVLCAAAPHYVEDRRSMTPALILAGGLLLTAMVAAYVLTNTARARRLVNVNRKLQSELVARARVEAERAAAHAAAAQEAAKLRTMIEGMEEGVVVAGAEDTVTEVNPWFLEKVGLGRDAVVGRKLWDLHPDSETTARLRMALEDFRSGGRREKLVVNRELLGMQLSFRVQPIFAENEYRGVILNLIDVTDLVEARRCAEAATRAKSEFLANMSHEIRTPMTAIKGFADILHDEVLCCVICPKFADCELRARSVEHAGVICRNSDHLLALIDDILDLSKIEAGRMDLERTDCKPCEIIAEVASLMRVRADAKGLSLSIEYEGAIPETIQIDPKRLRQVLINITGNAIKFTEVGEVRLVSRFVDDSAGPLMQFDVVDTGLGMTEEQLARLFRPFAQADASTARKFGGSGLGLAISKRLAELLGGNITVVETKPGGGTRMRVTVRTGRVDGVRMLEDPLAATVVSRDTVPAAPNDQLVLQGCRILLAEDGPDNQRLIAHVLRKIGAEVTVCENGGLAAKAALEARDAGQPYDVILMDMQMPLMDGYQATSFLRQSGYTGRIIALTAHAMSADREKCTQAGCDEYATKPINRKKLIEVIRCQIGLNTAAGVSL